MLQRTVASSVFPFAAALTALACSVGLVLAASLVTQATDTNHDPE
jgi:hypothetical protein